jgi:bacillithiol biosynthesis cysteine-adding enzyme BshC
MFKSTVDPACTGQFSPLFLDYVRQKPHLQPFYHKFPSVENFEILIENKTFEASKREVLTQVFQNQYRSLPLGEKVEENISALEKPTTFTVTTGHQINLMTGPLFFMYKIISTINLSKILKKKFPQYDFVPVYWMASEDHDFAEINHFHFDGKLYKWDSKQSGAVGEFKIDEVLKGSLKDWHFLPDVFRKAYEESANLSMATRKVVDHLFGDKGLLILDANEKDLKRLFIGVMEGDIISNKANDLIQSQNGKLEGLGYKPQLFPREVNFFYLKEGLRERIVKKDKRFEVLGHDISWTEEGIKREIRDFPERFSPNVVTRPLYQECILPNLAYLGGPAEVAYWFQLKPVFDHYNVPFPIIMARNCVLFVPKILKRKMDKIGMNAEDLFKSYDELRKYWVIKNAKEDVMLNGEAKRIHEIFNTLTEKSKKIDPTLEAAAVAAEKRTQKILNHLGQKLRKAEEKKQSDLTRQLREIKEGLFPGGVAQERKINLLNFYLDYPGFLDKLFDLLDPLDSSMNVLYPNEE